MFSQKQPTVLLQISCRIKKRAQEIIPIHTQKEYYTLTINIKI